MNKDKAIQLLERLQEPEPYEPMLTNDAYDAIQMAIDALSADGDTISREAAIEVIDSFNVFESRSDQIKLEQMIGELPPAQPDVPDINVGDMISRQAAIDALKNDMASLDHIIQGMSGYDVRLDAYVSQRNQVNCDIDTISNLPPAQPEPCEDAVSRKAAIDGLNDAVHEHNITDFDAVATILALPSVTPKQRWIPVTVINQNYIPELKDFPYGGLLFTYRTPKGKLLVREAWVERGRILGKKMNGVPIAYQLKPEPWEGDAE